MESIEAPCKPNRLTIVAHTHWDREWYEPFEAFRLRLLDVLDDALDLLEGDVRLVFTLDGQMALIDDYLELRPSSELRIRELVAQGRLHIGPWYTQADTLLTEGEGLIRNLALGMRRAQSLGGAMRLGYLPDQFGHAAQLPQLLRLFHIDTAVLWRGIGPDRPPHAFRWVGPDASELSAWWLQDGYATGRLLPSDPTGFADAVDRMLERLDGWLGGLPFLLPVGDDHVKLGAWLPDAVALLRARRPEIQIVLGTYGDHPVQPDPHIIAGELRSPAFAPVLAGVSSARIREKQAAARATTLLLRYAEPLCAWAALAGLRAPVDVVERAWRYLILNQAHDSAAGCGSDATHEDVKGRYRWAEQLGAGVRDHVLARLRVNLPDGTAAPLAVFHPGPAARTSIVETAVPTSLDGPLVAVGAGGIARPVQALTSAEGASEAPLFEGEFGPDELQIFVQGLDPGTPLFGLYLVGIAARADGPGRLRLDVTLGPEPVAAASLRVDQETARQLMPGAERIRVIVHKQGLSRRVLVETGPAPEAGFIPLVIERDGGLAPGRLAAEDFVSTDAEHRSIHVGSLSVTAQLDGTVLIATGRAPIDPVRAHLVIDQADRGDLYHYDPIDAEPVRPTLIQAHVVESGPLRARLRIEQTIELPIALGDDRRDRSLRCVTTPVTTEVTLCRGQERVEFVTTLDNIAKDHRLRVLFQLPFAADRLDVDHGLCVIERPLDPSVLGGGVERPARTGPHHLFIDATDGFRGAALMARGLPEHELIVEREGDTLALTLLRSVGWLARGDLACIDHAVGPMVQTPSAQELGEHCFEYAFMLHAGNWEGGQVMAEARRYAAPPVAFVPRGVAAARAEASLVAIEPATVILSAAYASERSSLVVRLLNAAHHAVLAQVRPAIPAREIVLVDPLEQPLADQSALTLHEDGSIRLAMRPWQLSTVSMRL